MDTISLIANSGKFKTTQDLYKNIDILASLLKQDLENICKAKSLFFSDFEASFKVALSQTKKTLRKKNLKGVKKFFRSNLQESLRLLRNRLLSNMKNANNLKYSFAFNPPVFSSFEDYNISKDYDLDLELEIEEIEKFDKETIKKALKKMWKEAKFDPDFNFDDLKDLCNKYKINLYDIIDKEELKAPKIGFYKKENGLRQGYFIFDEEVAA